jgi:pyrroloquinoline quinone (PQQ) biosynthesis protein C
MNFVEQLNKTLVPKLVGMHDAWRAYERDLDRQRLIRLLVETYHYIRHSVPLMELAGSKCIESRPAMAGYFVHHIEEEKDHDIWLLEDLSTLGLNPEEVKASLPLRPTLGMVSSQYYLIERVNPMGLLGYMYILEGLTPRGDSVEQYASRAGLPKAAMRTILEHAVLDPHHIEDMREAISSEELTDGDRELILFNAVATVEYLTDMYRALQRLALAEVPTVAVGDDKIAVPAPSAV